jgi:hypothetical protein
LFLWTTQPKELKITTNYLFLVGRNTEENRTRIDLIRKKGSDDAIGECHSSVVNDTDIVNTAYLIKRKKSTNWLNCNCFV